MFSPGPRGPHLEGGDMTDERLKEIKHTVDVDGQYVSMLAPVVAGYWKDCGELLAYIDQLRAELAEEQVKASFMAWSSRDHAEKLVACEEERDILEREFQRWLDKCIASELARAEAVEALKP